MKLRRIEFDPILCEGCGKLKPLYTQVPYAAGGSLVSQYRYNAGVSGDRCKECLYQDINRIYEVRERVMAIRIDYCTAPGGARLPDCHAVRSVGSRADSFATNFA